MTESTQPLKLQLGTRGSLLARVQSQWVADELEKRNPGTHIELRIYKTTGDQIADRPLHEAGGKGLFVKELEKALLDRQVDFAVHSFKDVPVTMPLVEQTDLTVAAVPPREDPRDALLSLSARRIADLPEGAVVGTGSLRRRAQLLALRPDLQIQPIRGNIDTRLRKLRSGEFTAIILAVAGLKRAALWDSEIMTAIEPDEMVPSAGQGALSVQCRRDAAQTAGLLASMHDPNTAACVHAEREVVRLLNGDCFSPIAAFARIKAGHLELRAVVGRRGGEPPLLAASASTDLASVSQAVAEVHQSLIEQGAMSHLHG